MQVLFYKILIHCILERGEDSQDWLPLFCISHVISFTSSNLCETQTKFFLGICCSGRHGFVVAITGVESVGKGLIRDGTGFVTFPVKYQCVVFRPFKGEILEAVVSMVNKVYILSLIKKS